MKVAKARSESAECRGYIAAKKHHSNGAPLTHSDGHNPYKSDEFYFAFEKGWNKYLKRGIK